MDFPLPRHIRRRWSRRPPPVARPSYVTVLTNGAASETRPEVADERVGVLDPDWGRSEPPIDRAEAPEVVPDSPPADHASVDRAEAEPVAPDLADAARPDGLASGDGGLPTEWPVDVASPSGPPAQSSETRTRAIPLPPPRHYDPAAHVDDVPEAVNVSPARLDGVDDHADDPEPGSWLPLRDAVREIGSLESMYRLARDGKLQSREGGHDRIEVWVADRDRLADAPTGPLEVTRATETAVSTTYAADLARQIAALMAPLSESHERNLQLARENGALSERVPSLERELQALRASTAADQHALDEVRQRLEAVVGANIALTDLLQSRALDREWEQPPPPPAPRRGFWSWLLLVIGASFAVAVVVLWCIKLLQYPFA